LTGSIDGRAGETRKLPIIKCSWPPEAIGHALADAYNALHDEELSLFPAAHETLHRLKSVLISHRRRLPSDLLRPFSARQWHRPPRPICRR
jgi:hypothetical protein